VKIDTRLRERIAHFDLADARSKREYNRRLFRVVAVRYDLITRILSFGQDRYWKRVLLQRVTRRGADEVLDVACGTGDLAIELARHLPAARITAMDLTPEMLIRAQRRAAQQGGAATEIRFDQGDMGELTYASQRFDVVTAGYALRNAPDLRRATGEIYRVLAPGGVVGVLDFSRSDTTAISTAQVGLLRVWGRIWGQLIHGNPEAYGYIAESLRRFPPRSEFSSLMRSTGFRSISERRFFFGMITVLIARK
jgi:demethylmenaquinone methyltransferase/2-methoxy-6-polyprenyl-1,4-benzoquinol methylase